MTNAAVDLATQGLGPLERKHLRNANFRAVAVGAEVTKTHCHIALANGLGRGFDGMDSMVFSLVSPLVITEFALDLPSYRSGVQIALFVGIAGLYFWPWLADRYGRRSLLAINIALFSLLMPVVALAPSFAVFVVGRSLVNFALNGEWSLGSMLVAETWPARWRGRVISINRATWCFGGLLGRGQLLPQTSKTPLPAASARFNDHGTEYTTLKSAGRRPSCSVRRSGRRCHYCATARRTPSVGLPLR